MNRERDLHALKEIEHCHIAQGLLTPTDGEDIWNPCLQLLSHNFNCPRGEGNSVFLLGLHSTRGNRPGGSGQVELLGSRVDSLTRPRSSQDRELQTPRRDRPYGSQGGDESADLREMHCLVMLYAMLC